MLTFNEFCAYARTYTEPHPDMVKYFNRTQVRYKKPNTWLMNNKKTQTDIDKIINQYRSILNKLSVQNFNVLADEIISVNIDDTIDVNPMKIVCDLIFDKAIIEVKFSSTYAKLARTLLERNQLQQQMITDKCTQLCEMAANPNMISFISELYLHNIITRHVINNYINKLFVNLEYILFSTMIRNIIIKNTKQEWEDWVNDTNQQIGELINSGNLCNKDRFALMDVLDHFNKI